MVPVSHRRAERQTFKLDFFYHYPFYRKYLVRACACETLEMSRLWRDVWWTLNTRSHLSWLQLAAKQRDAAKHHRASVVFFLIRHNSEILRFSDLSHWFEAGASYLAASVIYTSRIREHSSPVRVQSRATWS